LLLVEVVVVERMVEVVVLVVIVHQHLIPFHRDLIRLLLVPVAQQNQMAPIQEFIMYLHQCGLLVVVREALQFHMNPAPLAITVPAAVLVVEVVVEITIHSQQE
jgi:hypothetical protein